jgi:hypothetical protein
MICGRSGRSVATNASSAGLIAEKASGIRWRSSAVGISSSSLSDSARIAQAYNARQRAATSEPTPDEAEHDLAADIKN